jgi:peptide deformylase
MSILKIITAPDPLLLKTSAIVETVDEDIKTLAKNMIETMYHSAGIGLAAVQVGVLKRIIVIDVDYRLDKHGNAINKNPCVYINPVITYSTQKLRDYNEGCLSVPGEHIVVTRPTEIELDYVDIDGKNQSLKASWLLATCVQHEIDHLNGKTIISYASALKQNMMLKRLKKLKGM